MSFIVSDSRLSMILLLVMSLVGCTAPTYLTVPPADLADQQYRGLSPIVPTQPSVRDQHLGQLQAEMRYQEELLFRAEENRLQACRTPEATQVSGLDGLSALPTQRSDV
jgi:hypothetical protein